MNHLIKFTSNIDVQMLNGNHALEVRNSGVDKEWLAMHWLNKIKTKNRFVLSTVTTGRTKTFQVMPEDATSC